MNLHDNCACCGMSRRDFLKLSALFTSSFGAAIAADNWNLPVNANAKDQPVKIGYLPITDAAPLLVAHSRKLYQAEGLTAEQPRLFRSWAQIVEAFLARQVNVIHVLFPTSIWIRYGRNFPAKIVAWNHTNGSALTVLPDIENPRELGGKTIAVPFWYSIHNLVLQQLLQRNGLKIVRKAKDAPIASNEVNLVVLPPPDMVSALANKSIGGYIVAEPFNAAAENLKTGRVLRFTGDVWKNHACCVVFVHEEDIRQRKQWTQRVVNALVKAQLWSRSNRSEVARILSKDGGKYTPHPLPVLQRALTYYDRNFYKKDGAIQNPAWQVNRIDFQPYPFPSYTEELVRLLKTTQVEGNTDFLQKLQPRQVARDLVDDSFVRNALQQVGGPKAFGLPNNLSRIETIKF
ncbi:ABC transporter substrate-binding protein [Microcystis wesenbergii FACHB-1317]|uniref:ABC transporter substrate-binding protein n=1 Tax=Microcystis TaxID=1125 RepID=UPI000E375DB0|nr:MULTISPECIES: ABC transporter substrate-binding protein [Microcystis]MBD2291809.1 ABC transporter substrate-binding protein [Microcystis wesenbergii FACHB-1317]REJ59467.1 MAG: ABC transporter substrate-binding protein [Microcystis aeruginosa TA09]UZO74264.1 ABC transporter substrate-binding protein [Microcystis aeruginosa str. Chao 1910]